ncbi:hypothetical protein L7F22_067472 [Adiantum nelumboides]|nr:hypothetical protein [Adiantum nelumboides]
MDPGGAFDDTQSPADDDWENEATDSSPAPWARLGTISDQDIDSFADNHSSYFAVAVDRSNPDIALWESNTVIGRTHFNGNRKVSKFHCRILKDSSGDVLMNNLSKNGTVINGTSLNNEQRCNLQHGDEISLGPHALGVPHYIFHVLDRTFGYESKRSNEVMDSQVQSDSAKRLKSTFDKAKKHKKRADLPSSSSSSSDSSSKSSEAERRGKKRSKKQRHRRGKKTSRKSKSRRVDDSSTDSSTNSSDSEDGHFYANKKNFYKANQYDFLEDKSKKVREFKEGGQSIKFETFLGYKDASKALSFIQQFDIAFAGGRY